MPVRIIRGSVWIWMSLANITYEQLDWLFLDPVGKSITTLKMMCTAPGLNSLRNRMWHQIEGHLFPTHPATVSCCSLCCRQKWVQPKYLEPLLSIINVTVGIGKLLFCHFHEEWLTHAWDEVTTVHSFHRSGWNTKDLVSESGFKTASLGVPVVAQR